MFNSLTNGQGLGKSKIGDLMTKKSGEELCEWIPKFGKLRMFFSQKSAHQNKS